MKDFLWFHLLVIALIVALLPFSLYMHFAGDRHSWWFRFMEAGELPGRCVIR